MTSQPWGLSDAGFYRPPLTELIESIIVGTENDLREQGYENWQQSRDKTNPVVVYASALGSALDTIWGAMERIWHQMSATTATGQALDALARVVGITRLAKATSLVRLTLTGTAGTVIPAGTRFRGPALGLYALNTAVTIGAGGTVEGLCTSVNPGDWPIVDPVAIVNPIFGLTSAAVAEPYSPGRLTETDAQLRLRFRAADSRYVAGRGTENAIAASLRAVAGVTAVDVIANRQDVPDSEGRPPHSFEAIIYPAIDETRIGPVMLFHQVAGIETFGSVEWETTDDSGTERTVRWSVADSVGIEVQVLDVSVDSGSSASYHPAIQTALGVYINSLQVGQPVSYVAIVSAVASVSGVVDAGSVKVRRSPSDPFVAAGLALTFREKATINPSTDVVFTA